MDKKVEFIEALVYETNFELKRVGFLLGENTIENELINDLREKNSNIVPVYEAEFIVGYSENSKDSHSFLLHAVELFTESQATRMTLCLHPSALRFETGRLKSLRDSLLNIKTNHLSLSALVQYDSTYYSILLFDKTRKRNGKKDVVLIDGKDISFDEFNTDKILRDILFGNLGKRNVIDFRDIILKNLSLIDIENDYSTMNEEKTLQDIVTFIKSPVYDSKKIHETDNVTNLQCFSVKYFSDFGYTMPKNFENKVFLNKNFTEKHFLRPNDIVLVTLRSIGRIALIDPAFSETHCVPSNSTYILRTETVDPRALYVYLSSESVRAHFQNFCLGDTVPRISMHNLKKLPVPGFIGEENTRMIEIFEEMQKISNEIQALREKGLSLFQESFF